MKMAYIHQNNTMVSAIDAYYVSHTSFLSVQAIQECLVMSVVSSCAAETESEKSIGLELSLDEDAVIGQDFFVRAEVTNKTDSIR